MKLLYDDYGPITHTIEGDLVPDAFDFVCSLPPRAEDSAPTFEDEEDLL